MIQLHNISLDLGPNQIFDSVNCTIRDTDRVGVIGRNGAGKSTLLKIIAGIIKPTSGMISIKKNARIAYLAQEDVLASSLSVFDEAFSAFTKIIEIQKKIGSIEASIANNHCDDELLAEYTDLQATLLTLDRHEAIKQTNIVLEGLGFTPAMTQKTVNQLSTGWKMRLALAKLLLIDADMLLFDEPTNHLDMVTQQWFLKKLQSMNTGFILISHDRAYLEQACDCTLEIERGRVSYYRGNLQKYLAEKEIQLAVARSTRARQDKEITQKKVIIDRFRGGSEARARQAQNLIKQVNRIELVEIEEPLPTISFSFPEPKRSGSIVLTVNNLAHGFNDTMLFGNVCAEIQRGERIALVAANGVGKTTLINCIAGIYKPTKGSVQFGHNVESAFFEQDQAERLDPAKTIFQEIQDSCAKSTDLEIRKLLGSFQFSGDDAFKKIQVLSGGEKNRVAMIKVLLKRANFLILDEPTNHLDLYAKDVLRQALASYAGTMLFVSHDLDFVNKLATRIIELTPTRAISYPGTYEEFCASKQPPPTITSKVSVQKKIIANKKPNSQTEDLRKKAAELERQIERLEQNEKQAIELLGIETYGSEKYNKALERFTDIQKKLKQAQSNWEYTLNAIEMSSKRCS